jgi:hypothetical protein
MKRNLSRRDFLKLTGLGLSALAFKPYLLPNYEYFATPKRLPQFPASEIIGRVVDNNIPLRSRPTDSPDLNTVIGTLNADTLVEWNREVIGSVTQNFTFSNQRFVETPQGYVYGSNVQLTRNIPNTPIAEIPAGQPGFWAEVTVPYIDLAHEGAVFSTWLQDHILYNFPPRLYFGQVVWIDRVRNTNGFIEYRWNEDANGRGYGAGAYGEFYWADGMGLKVLTEEDVSPINPDVDPAEKTISVDLDYQTLSCFEGNKEVFFARIASGRKYDPTTFAETDQYATPATTLYTWWKLVSKDMTAGGTEGASGYSTPGVPWCTFIDSNGVAIHGAFWHNAFGERRSHGCINVTPEEAKWIFRWTTPYVSLQQSEIKLNWPDIGTIVNSTETKF